MRTMCSREIFKKKCRQQQIFDSDLKGAWHYNHVTFTPIAKKFYVILQIDLYVIHSMCQTYDKSKGGDTRELQSRMVPPPKKLGRVTLNVITAILKDISCSIVTNLDKQRRNMFMSTSRVNKPSSTIQDTANVLRYILFDRRATTYNNRSLQ